MSEAQGYFRIVSYWAIAFMTGIALHNPPGAVRYTLFFTAALGLSAILGHKAYGYRAIHFACASCRTRHRAAFRPLFDSHGIAACPTCGAWLQLRTRGPRDREAYVKDYMTARDFDALAAERIRCLELLASRWDGEPAELKRLRGEARSRQRDDELLGTALQLLGFALVVALIVVAVWALVSAIKWTWGHPLF